MREKKGTRPGGARATWRGDEATKPTSRARVALSLLLLLLPSLPLEDSATRLPAMAPSTRSALAACLFALVALLVTLAPVSAQKEEVRPSPSPPLSPRSPLSGASFCVTLADTPSLSPTPVTLTLPRAALAVSHHPGWLPPLDLHVDVLRLASSAVRHRREYTAPLHKVSMHPC